MTPEEARTKRRHRNERIAATILVLVLAAVVFAFVRWNAAEEDALRADRRYVPLPEKITPEILLLRDYVRIDTSTAEGVEKGARWIALQLARRGVRSNLIESTPGRWNVYARIRGRKPGRGLLLLNHIDVAGVNPSEWQQKPFEGTIKFNQLWGRGTLDMKALALIQLLAFADLAQSGRAPEHDLAFLATAEEEQGSDDGLKWLLANRSMLFDGIEYAITEGGITEVMSERMAYFGIEVSAKQNVVTVVEHPSREALEKLRIDLEPYIFPDDPTRVLPEVRTFFRHVAPTRIANKPLLSDIDAAIARGEFWKLPYTYRELVQNTIRVSAPWPEGERWRMRVSLLNLPDEDPRARIAWLARRIASSGATLRVERVEGPVPASPADTPVFAILASEAASHYRTAAGSEVLYASGTDCRFLRVRGIACYGVSPYLADITQSTSIHRANERIRLDWFMDGLAYFRKVIRTWSAG